MKRTALVLAAHGSRVDPRTNQALVDLAARISARHLFDEVATAFHQGTPTYATVLDTLICDEVVVVPVMTSAGYYSDQVLPSELAKNRMFIGRSLVQTSPIGTQTGMVDLVHARATELAKLHRLNPRCTTIALIGHGTARNTRSRLATESLAEALADRSDWGQVVVAFLDEAPGVETIRQRATQANILVIPFLICGGPHVIVDIPARLGLDASTLHSWPASIEYDGRRLVIDRAIGMDPGIEDIIVDLATRSASRMEHTMESVA